MIYLSEAKIIELDHFRQVGCKSLRVIGRLEVISEYVSGFQ